MYTNTKVTLYRLVDGKYKRDIADAFYQDTANSTFSRTGLTSGIKVNVIIPYNGTQYSFTTGKDYVVKGVCDVELDISSPQKHSESMKQLKEMNFVTVMLADCNLFGSECMRHYELGCE